MRRPVRLIPALVFLFASPVMAADSWRCATIGMGAEPALAQSAAGYLERAGRIYPSQLLGMVSASGRLYLLNANDGGWSERVRQGLMELRLAEPDITAARRFQATVSGRADVDVPSGDYVCLARDRAGRHGLALGGRGEVRLAPGRSVHLVDPHEGAIVVEVRAVGREPLDFREILALSGRSGIYAGLTSRRPQAEVAAAVPAPATPVAVAVGPAGQPDGEVIITPRPAEASTVVEEKKPIVVAAAAPPEAATPAPAPVVVAPPKMEEPPARVAAVQEPQAPPPARPLAPEATPAVLVAAVEPVPVVPPAPPPSSRPASQSQEEYAKAMKTLLALRRSGGVRSISEMTYVHPAVQDLRSLR